MVIRKSQFQTASRVVQLGNSVTWLRNQNTQFMGLTATQSEAIRFILKNYAEKELTAADLMEHLHLSQSTVAGIIKRLENKSLIKRTIAVGDGRKSIITPSEDGLRLEENLKLTAVDTEQIIVHGMTPTEQAQFNRLLQKALDNINAVRKMREESNG
ncbi:MAG: winged helix-turn-helix transcriptional regulator [Lachnospiraceae bacterium]|nr:winged helix-turn-helix transcriptional regulator [Lachnospiraceae bacterium]